MLRFLSDLKFFECEGIYVSSMAHLSQHHGESFVLSNSNFIYSYSYIFPSVTEFGDGSV